jgi:2-phosphoglycerate kinase
VGDPALAHVYWLGGSPCAGKSSMAEILVEQVGLTRYSVDAELDRHVPHLTPDRFPILSRWTHDPVWDDLWMRPHAELLADVIGAYREHCELVYADVAALPTDRPVLVEGTCLLPTVVRAWQASPRHGLWVTPSEPFQRTHYPQRGAWVQWILNQCSDPAQAFANWMDRDVAFARWVERTCAEQGLTVLSVDGSVSIAVMAQRVADHFGWSNHGPAC